MEQKEVFAEQKNSDEFLGSSKVTDPTFADSEVDISDSEKTKNPVFSDLHIHSRFSRATSKNLTIDNLIKYAKIKGLSLLGTGDFTHEKWIEEVRKELVEENGVLSKEAMKFIWQGEISLIYTQGRGRRVHLVILAPSFEIVRQINSYLDTKGRRDYDGRPIFKITCEEFVDNLKKISGEIEIIPAHIWTPWFGVFGSMSGFDSLKEAFGDKVKDIHAIETGMSSDPEMCWRIKELENKTIMSFSDSHSFWPFRLGREATIFNLNESFSYKDIIQQIRENSILGTVEVDPAYGKYHYDGHANCKFSCSYEDSKKLNNICPKCGNSLTIGVENRVDKLANNPQGFKHSNSKPYYKVLPLHEIIALGKASTLSSQKTWGVYNSLLEKFKSEFNILLNLKKEELLKALPQDERIAELVMLNRTGKLEVEPGYDGVYGKLKINQQKGLSKFF